MFAARYIMHCINWSSKCKMSVVNKTLKVGVNSRVHSRVIYINEQLVECVNSMAT